MGNAWLFVGPAIIAAAWGLAFLVFLAMGAWVPPEVRAWMRIASQREYSAPQNPISRIFFRFGFTRRLLMETDIRKLLLICGKDQTAMGFWARNGALGLLVFLVFGGLDVASGQSSGKMILPLWIPLVAGIGIVFAGLAGLRQKVTKVRVNCDLGVGDMLCYLAVVLGSQGGGNVRNSVKRLALCLENSELPRIVVDEQWKTLAPQELGSTIEEYETIARVYGIEIFHRLAEQIQATDLGMPPEEVYLRLADSVYQTRLTEARLRAAKAKTRVIVPMALMLLPLLALLLIPIFLSLAQVL